MGLCINSACDRARDAINQGNSLFCDRCGSKLLIQDIYRVIRKLGEGGFGTTYLVDDAGEKKVLKVLSNTAPKAIELFEREARILQQLNHPGIPKVEAGSLFVYYPQGTSQSLHCLIMEYIEGENLYDYLERQNYQPISEKAAWRWLRQLVQILHQVHRKNYFHRDIKPQNIMLRSNGQLVLIDFGAAREETQTYFQKQQGKRITGIFSPDYAPYEQKQGQAEPRSDFFALGRTFVFLLTGKQPGEFQDSLKRGLQWQHSAQTYSQYWCVTLSLTAPYWLVIVLYHLS